MIEVMNKTTGKHYLVEIGSRIRVYLNKTAVLAGEFFTLSTHDFNLYYEEV